MADNYTSYNMIFYSTTLTRFNRASRKCPNIHGIHKEKVPKKLYKRLLSCTSDFRLAYCLYSRGALLLRFLQLILSHAIGLDVQIVLLHDASLQLDTWLDSDRFLSRQDP